MNGADAAGLLQLWVALPLAFLLAFFVLRANLRSRDAHALTALLVLEGAGQAAFGAVRQAPEPLAIPLSGLGITLFAWATFSYLLVLRSLRHRLTKPFEHPLVRVVAALLVPLPATLHLMYSTATRSFPDLRTQISPGPDTVGFVWSLFGAILVGLFALVAAVAAYRSADAGSLARRRARAFVAAFAVRDGLFAMAIGLGAFFSQHDPARTEWLLPLWPAATILFLPLVAYGILTTQLFDLDLKLRLTIRRGTVLMVFVAVFVAVSAAVQEWLGQTQGILAGAAAAGFLVFVLHPLQRMADRVASAALPDAKDSPAYRAFRKLEVYKAALEGPAEDGLITEKERRMLDRLKARLGIPEEDARSLERDVLRDHTAASPADRPPAPPPDGGART